MLEPTVIKMTVQIRSQWQRDVQKVIKAVNTYISANFPKNVWVMFGGTAVLEAEVTNLVVASQIISVLVSILMVFIIIALSNRSFVAGIIAALPLTVTILCNFAVMSFFCITLNMGTVLIASAVVGIGIDYTIHFIEFFKREYQLGGDFLKRTFAGCGKAIIINAVSVGMGFAVLAFSQFRALAQFGALVTFSMITTAAVSLTLIPVLLTTIKPKFIYGETNAER
jgi:predicted RND superfamily exporter protein